MIAFCSKNLNWSVISNKFAKKSNFSQNGELNKMSAKNKIKMLCEHMNLIASYPN
jgi:hypothetical protein